jgi:hypothetical protein
VVSYSGQENGSSDSGKGEEFCFRLVCVNTEISAQTQGRTLVLINKKSWNVCSRF